MKKGVYVVYTSPATVELDTEYNRWYSEEHLPDLLKVNGVVGASRFRAVDGDDSYQYLAIYELEGDVNQAVENIKASRADFRQTSALRRDPPTQTRIFEFIERQGIDDGESGPN